MVKLKKILCYIHEGDEATYSGDIEGGFQKYSRVSDVDIQPDLLMKTAQKYHKQQGYSTASFYLRAMVFKVVRKE